MLVETKEVKEYHDNGQLAYSENIGIIAKGYEDLYPNRITHTDGYDWIRLGKQEKFHDTGVRAWILEYDTKGNVIKNNDYKFTPNRRADGTYIQGQKYPY